MAAKNQTVSAKTKNKKTDYKQILIGILGK